MIRSYRDLDAWKRAIGLVKMVYIATKDFSKDELYGLTNQIRRCAISIPSNIAEGKTRQHINEYMHFLYISLSSCAELETQIIISKELKYLSKALESELLEEIDHIGRMIRNLIKNLRAPSTEHRAPNNIC